MYVTALHHSVTGWGFAGAWISFVYMQSIPLDGTSDRTRDATLLRWFATFPDSMLSVGL